MANVNSSSSGRLFFSDRRILVVGDVMLDRYLVGSVRRISPEAPIPVVNLEREWACPGGAGNVAASLAGLGARVTLAGVVGADDAGSRLRTEIDAAGIEEAIFPVASKAITITKTRVLGSDKHQLVRLDVDGNRREHENAADMLGAQLPKRFRQFDAICIADYDKGALPLRLLRVIIEEARKLRIPCLVDPKKSDFGAYAGATLLTPNLLETERALGCPMGDCDSIGNTAIELRRELALDFMIITRGAQGMTLAGADRVAHFPAKVRAVADVAGAGDTVVATLAACLASDWDMQEACRLASVAAGIAVSQPGVYVVRAAELAQAWSGQSAKILDWDAAQQRLRDWRRAERKIVFTNGCYDILHAGHLHCLEQARRMGDALIVGLNSDVSVKMIKGPKRPIITESHRAALLAGLACVDAIVLFDELTPERLVRSLEPDVLVKGGDYDAATMAGADFVRARGGKVVTIPLLNGLSTSGILTQYGAARA